RDGQPEVWKSFLKRDSSGAKAVGEPESHSTGQKGGSSRYSALPARDSDTLFIKLRFADPVKRIIPGCRDSSTFRLMASRMPGSRCTSSRVTGRASKSESGFDFACSRISSLSSVK